MSSIVGALGSYTDSASRWYNATTCELRQDKYEAQTPYNREPDVAFLHQTGNIIPLRTMLDPHFSMPQWDHPWTKSEGVGQKITIRVLLGKKFAKTFNARRETSTREARSKNKLAQEVARATADALDEYDARMGWPPQEYALVGLRHVAQGSWQPIIHVRARS